MQRYPIICSPPSVQNHVWKSYLVSAAFHATLFLGFWYMHQKPFHVEDPAPISIDFSMLEEAPPAPPTPKPLPQHTPKPQQAAVPPEEQPVLPDSTQTAEADTLPPQEQVAEAPVAPEVPSVPSASEVQAQKQEAVAGYVKQQFVYIRKIIASNLAYPSRAQEREEEGTLLLSFVIQEDGRVQDVKVLRSSGYDLLDENAVATVHRSAPFPKPPFAAELKVPVTYKLL